MRGRAIHKAFRLRADGCDAEAVFAVVADVERYPEFLPGIVSARIITREDGRWLVDNDFAIGPARFRFRSVAEFEPPQALTIRSNDRPWRRFLILWRVRDDENGAWLSCEAALEFRSRALAALAAFAADEIEDRVRAAFAARLRALPFSARAGARHD